MMSSQDRSRYNAPAAILAMTLLGLTGSAIPVVIPGLVDALSRHAGMTTSDAASIVSGEMLGMTLSTAVMALFVQRFDRRLLAVAALAVVALADIGSIFFGGFSVLFGLRLAAGLGEGALIALIAAALGGTEAPARNFGIFMAANMLLSAILFRAVPIVVQGYGMNGVFAVLLALVGAAALALPAFPSRAPILDAVENTTSTPMSSAPQAGRAIVAMALIGFLAFFISLGIVWPLMPQFAETLGVPQGSVAAALSNATLAGLAAALLASFTGSKLGDRVPLIAGAAVLIGSMFAIPTMGTAIFALACAALMGGWMFSAPYWLATLARAESSGRAVALSMSLQFLGLTIGPMLGPKINASGSGFTAVWAGVAIMLTAVALIMVATARLGRPAPQTAPA